MSSPSMPLMRPDADEARRSAGTLRQLAGSLEGRFVTVGDRLYGATERIRGLAASLEELTAELDRAELRDAARQLIEVASEVRGMTASIDEERALLTRLLAANQEVGRRIDRLRRTVGVISILGLNARMTASSIGTGSEDLSAFTDEIVRVAKTAVTTVDGYRQEYEKLVAILGEAAEAEAAFDRAHRSTFGAVAERLGASVATVEARREAASRTTADLSLHWKHVNDGIAAVVRALQIGDMTRQRIEHVCEALEELAGGWTEAAGAWSEGLSKAEQQSIGAGVCRLQSVQLGHAADEFAGEMRHIAGSLETLAEDTGAIVRHGSDVYGGGQRKDASFLEDLETQLAATRALLLDCRAARAKLDEVVASLGQTVRTLRERLRTVHDIQEDMRLVGLNTTLRCGRLGTDGKALAVIAQELRQYANQTIEDARSLTASLEEIDRTAAGFDGEDRGRNGNRIEAMQQAMSGALETFQSTGRRLSDALATLASEGAAIRALLAETQLGDEVGAVLENGRARLEALGAGAPEPEGALAERIRLIVKERYTMESERQIHERLVAGKSSEVAAAPAASVSTEAFLEDALF